MYTRAKGFLALALLCTVCTTGAFPFFKRSEPVLSPAPAVVAPTSTTQIDKVKAYLTQKAQDAWKVANDRAQQAKERVTAAAAVVKQNAIENFDKAKEMSIYAQEYTKEHPYRVAGAVIGAGVVATLVYIACKKASEKEKEARVVPPYII